MKFIPFSISVFLINFFFLLQALNFIKFVTCYIYTCLRACMAAIGIYMGDGKVIHVTRGAGLLVLSSCDYHISDDRVVCCSLQD